MNSGRLQQTNSGFTPYNVKIVAPPIDVKTTKTVPIAVRIGENVLKAPPAIPDIIPQQGWDIAPYVLGIVGLFVIVVGIKI